MCRGKAILYHGFVNYGSGIAKVAHCTQVE
jgi:hypothetical protein